MLERIEIRPVKGGYIVATTTSEEYEDEESEKHTDWNTEEEVALEVEDALKLVKNAL